MYLNPNPNGIEVKKEVKTNGGKFKHILSEITTTNKNPSHQGSEPQGTSQKPHA